MNMNEKCGRCGCTYGEHSEGDRGPCLRCNTCPNFTKENTVPEKKYTYETISINTSGDCNGPPQTLYKGSNYDEARSEAQEALNGENMVHIKVYVKRA